jgi:hypothetical protein
MGAGMRKDKGFYLRVLLAGVLFFTFSLLVGYVPSSPAAAPQKPYYEGKVITLVVPSGAGAGADLWARMITRHLGRVIPGNPAMVVRNLPAASGLVAANLVYSSRPDGRTLLFGSGKLILPNIMRPKGTEYYLEKMYPLYCSPFGAIYFSRPSIVKEPIDIVKAKGLVFGYSGPTAPAATAFIFAKELLGLQVDRMIFGYNGAPDTKLAFLTGELNCTGTGTDNWVPSWKPLIDRGEASIVFQSGLLDADGNCVRDKVARDVPTVGDLYQQINGKTPSGLDWDAYKLCLGMRSYDSGVLMGPGTPADLVSIMKKAAMAMASDPKFMEEANKMAAGCSHIVGDALRGYAKGVSGSPEAVKYMKDYLSAKFAVVF